jgi:hypothetical protein
MAEQFWREALGYHKAGQLATWQLPACLDPFVGLLEPALRQRYTLGQHNTGVRHVIITTSTSSTWTPAGRAW